MLSIIKLMKSCFEYCFSNKEKTHLIDMINNTQNDLHEDVKQDLIASIMLDKSEQIMERINNLPEKNKTELIASIMQVREMYIPKSIEYLPESIEYLPKSIEYLPKSIEYLPESIEYIEKTEIKSESDSSQKIVEEIQENIQQIDKTEQIKTEENINTKKTNKKNKRKNRRRNRH